MNRIKWKNAESSIGEEQSKKRSHGVYRPINKKGSFTSDQHSGLSEVDGALY